MTGVAQVDAFGTTQMDELCLLEVLAATTMNAWLSHPIDFLIPKNYFLQAKMTLKEAMERQLLHPIFDTLATEFWNQKGKLEPAITS